ncbi:MAG: hypothetical protein Q9213_006598 [Squamulea squamosa]
MTLTNREIEQVSRDKPSRQRAPPHKEVYDRAIFNILLMSITYASYAMPTKNNETEHEKSIRECVQERANSLEDAISKLDDQFAKLKRFTQIRKFDDLDTANSNLKSLTDLTKPLGCQVEGHTNETCQFEVLHDLIDKRAGDIERMKAEEEAVPSPQTESDAGDSDVESEKD